MGEFASFLRSPPVTGRRIVLELVQLSFRPGRVVNIQALTGP